jgi:ribosomal protein S18 acetylase RimI-like enzyme
MIEILQVIPETLRDQAGKIYYDAFQRKLQPLVGQPLKTSRVLTAGLNLNLAIGVVVDGRLCGLAGLHNQAGIFSRVTLPDSLRELGLARGMFSWAVLNLFGAGANCPPEHLRIAAIAVDAQERGKGYGSLLLNSIFDKARREGYTSVRLEVVDTNLRARQLYERAGFLVVQTHSYPISSNWLGFSRDHVMVKALG